MGLRELPKTDHQIARVLRYFNSDNEEIMINVEKTPVKLWENFWCFYSDCVFVDLSAHKHDQTIYVRNDLKQIDTRFLRIDLSYILQVSDPIKVVENQITDTNSYMNSSLKELLSGSMMHGASIDEQQLEAHMKKSITSSTCINDVFSLTDLEIKISSGNELSGVHHKQTGSKLSEDMNTLLEIAKNSNLEPDEEEELKKLILNGPE
jgi:hypothetical protein